MLPYKMKEITNQILTFGFAKKNKGNSFIFKIVR